jgi:hypothetical protein
MTPQDRVLSIRTLVLGVTLLLVTGVILALTDEPGSGIGARSARLSVLAPASAALAVYLAVGQMQRRGELTALSALGVRRERATLGAVFGGWFLCGAGLCVMASSLSDPAALFPAPARGAEFVETGPALVETSQGVRVDSLGKLTFQTPQPRPDAPLPPRSGALLSIASLGASAPVWAARLTRLRGAAYSAAATCALALIGFHSVAAGRLDPFWLALCGLPLALYAWMKRT